MKRNLINFLVIVATLITTAIIRVPFEQELHTELREKKLIPKSLDVDARLALRQKSFVTGFGSFRPTLAAFMSLAASNDHSKQNWEGVEKKFDNILLLDPENPFYWETASWQMISNAAGNSKNKRGMSYLQRNKLYHQYIDKGEAIIKRGMKLNPDNWKIQILAANHYANKYRRPNYSKAADEYLRVARMDGIEIGRRLYYIRTAVYCLNKVPERHQEAYDLALKLFESSARNHTPSLNTSVWVGQNHPLNKVTRRYTLEQLYPLKFKTATQLQYVINFRRNLYLQLGRQWQAKTRQIDRKLEARYGIEKLLHQLEKELKIPFSKSIFYQKPMILK